MDVPKDRLCHKSAARLIQIVLSLSVFHFSFAGKPQSLKGLSQTLKSTANGISDFRGHYVVGSSLQHM